MTDYTHPFKFDYGQSAQVIELAPECFRPNAFVSVVGMTHLDAEYTTPFGTFPAGLDLYLIEYDDGSSIEVPESYIKIVGKGLGIIRIRFDDQCVWCTEDDVEVWRLSWKSVTGIGYASGYASWQYTHFLVLRDNTNPPKFKMMAIAWEGVHELCEFIDKTKNVKYSTDGRLTNCSSLKTTTIWPPSESGKSLGVWETSILRPCP